MIPVIMKIVMMMMMMMMMRVLATWSYQNMLVEMNSRFNGDVPVYIYYIGTICEVNIFIHVSDSIAM